jgi:hypothetical protein
VPFNDTIALRALLPLLVTAMLAERAPWPCGEKRTLTVHDARGATGAWHVSEPVKKSSWSEPLKTKPVT